MNYTGGKFKLLPQLTPLFPAQCSTFVDLFCGGCDVGININADKVIFNDSNKSLIGLLNWFAERNAESVIQLIDDIIERYGLSRTDLNGYSFYGCDSSHGLAKYNKNIYLKLRSDFNNLDVGSESYYPMLYTLIVYAFNNQIRFNRDGEYNLPVGKRDFNKRMQEKIADFSDRLHSLNCRILNKDFRKLDLSELDTESFVYADPPYLITCASYNEQNGWTAKDEKDLLSLLDVLHDKGIKFALSNVLVSNNKTNEILSSWIEKRPSYRTIDLNMTYSNSNYHRKGKTTITREVLVVNY
jgi:DNA adenine methylase Dam